MLPLDLLACLAGVSALGLGNEPFGWSDKPYTQRASDSENLLRYLANTGPYVDRKGYGLSRNPPEQCTVDQVVMLSRHGARWPSVSLWKDQEETLEKILPYRQSLKGSLEFVKDWQPFASKDSGWLQQESLAGPYSGLLQAYQLGVNYRRRYDHLYDVDADQLPLFLSAYQRDVDTGRKFGEGFLQWNYTDSALVNLVLEENGADTLNPKCKLKNSTSSKNTLCSKIETFDEFKQAAVRLNQQSDKSLNLTGEDVIRLMQLVGYELNVRGYSPWANVFTAEEWVAFEYYTTTTVYCGRGAGSVEGPIEGSLFLNATRELLTQGPSRSKLPLAFTFSHDTNIIQLVSAMGIDSPANRSDWETTQVSFAQRFDAANFVPQLGHIVFERLSCKAPGNSSLGSANGNSTGYNAYHNTSISTNFSNSSSTYVRVVINEAVVPLDGCSNGPGKSCSLKNFSTWVDDRLKGINFAEQCEISADEPKELKFFWNWNKTTDLNHQNYEPFQATTLNLEGNPQS